MFEPVRIFLPRYGGGACGIHTAGGTQGEAYGQRFGIGAGFAVPNESGAGSLTPHDTFRHGIIQKNKNGGIEENGRKKNVFKNNNRIGRVS